MSVSRIWAVQTLSRLGLTPGEAKAYLTLAQLEKATAKEISKSSNIARQEVYRLLAELEKKSLIERMIASPTEFKAVPIENGISVLIGRKKNEISEIKKETSKILKALKQNNAKTAMDENTGQFLLIPAKEDLVLRLKQRIKKTREKVDIIAGSQSFAQAMFKLHEEINNNPRGVRVRVLAYNFEGTQSLTNSTPIFVDYDFELKSTDIHPHGTLVIIDKKEVFMACFPSNIFAEAPALWSNNSNLVQIAQSYFESMWEKATLEEMREPQQHR